MLTKFETDAKRNRMDAPEVSQDDLIAAHAAGAAAAARFEETLKRLIETTTSVDALETLSRVGFSVILHARRPEEQQVGIPGLQLFHLELIQALALSRNRSGSAIDTDFPAVTQQIIDLIAENSQAYRERRKSKMSSDAADNRRLDLLARIQEWTLIVRGSRHGFQTRAYTSDLARAINPTFRHHMGCDATEVVAALSLIVETAKSRLRAHIEEMRTWSRKKTGISMIDAFVLTLPQKQQSTVKEKALPLRYDRRQLHAYLWNLTESRLHKLFTFEMDQLTAAAPSSQRQRLSGIISTLSFRFGDVKPADLHHLHLLNPVQLKPLIQVDDIIFCPGPQILSAHFAEILEALCASHPKLKKASEKARAEWLEARLSTTVRKFLPHADVRENVTWSDDGGKTTWESDLVAVMDKSVFVFEAKSAKIKPAARRGAFQSLKETLQDLVVDPSEQSLRFKQRILDASAPIAFQTRQGPLEVDPAEVRDIIRINVLQDAVGPLSAHWPQLMAAGLIPENTDMAPSMSVFELETVFDVLTHEIERCHYLNRRTELERNAIYVADELDLLAVYLETQFVIGEDEFDGVPHQWYGASLRLLPTYDDDGVKQTLRVPISRTPFWAQLLDSLEERRPPGWTRFGQRLLNVDPMGQKKIENLLKQGLKQVTRKPNYFFSTGVTLGPSRRLQTIAIGIGSDSPPQFNFNVAHIAESIFVQGGQDNLLLIYWFFPRTTEAYDFMGVLKRNRFAPTSRSFGPGS